MYKCLSFIKYNTLIPNSVSCILRTQGFRNCSTLRHVQTETSFLKMYGKPFPYIEDFNSTFQTIYQDLAKDMDETLVPISKRLKKVLDYNISSGKKIRGLIVVMAYEMFSNGKASSNDLKLAMILGWCIEMLQGFFIVTDDIMDNGITRRGKDCWFRLPDVKLQAFNDAILIKESIFRLLKLNFSNKDCYLKILEDFNEVTEKTAWGQALDMASNPTGQRPLFESFTLDYYWKTIEYKTSYYTFCLPVFLAMHLIGGFNQVHFLSTQNICLKIGKLFQVQDDYLDVYGDSTITGKIGKDIQEGKCTWFAAMALKSCTVSQKQIFQDNYGIQDPLCMEKVLKIYKSLLLEEKYFQLEAELFLEITSAIDKLDDSPLNKELFINILDGIHKRKK